ncbi:MAG: 4Fe-4S dicluster domain-containing protein [Nitrospiria bacterium]
MTIDGTTHAVSDGMTVIQAMWHLGRPMIHGVGCLGGVCGACPISIRLPNQMVPKTALACQTLVSEGAEITFLPSDTSKKEIAPLPNDAPTPNTLFQYYPETRRCVACGACTAICPQKIDAMASVREAINGNMTEAAERYVDCVMCGLCAVVCDVKVRPHRVGLYARRLTGAFHAQEATQLKKRIEEIVSGRYEDQWAALMEGAVR